MQTTTRPATGEPSLPSSLPPDPQRPSLWSRARALLARRSEPLFLLRPDDGWLTIALTALVVYTTIGSIQSVTPPWAPGLQILTATTTLGLLLGVVALLQRLVPEIVVHIAATAIGAYYAFRQTAGAVLDGDNRSLLDHLGVWLQQALANRPSNDNSIFLLFLGVLSFLLAYLSVWLVGHSRHPWLAVMANGVVLLINLNWASDDKQFFVVIFLLLALLLLLRFTLAENMRLWQARRLRFSPDLSWDVMQIGTVFVVCVLLLAYVLPAGAANPSVTAFWADPNGAWTQIQQRWGALFGNLSGPGRGKGIGVFTTNLQLVGDVHLPSTEILRYTADNPGEYLITETLDTYDGHGSWNQSLARSRSFAAEAPLPHSSTAVHLSNQTVTLTNVSANQLNLFAAGEPASFSLPTDVNLTVPGDVPTAWFAQNALYSGQRYSAQSYLSTATIDQLRAAPDPAHAPDAYPKYVVNVDLQNSLNKGAIAPQVIQTANDWTAGTTNMYDAAQAIESHLRTFQFRYINGAVPANEDAIVWFLQVKHGYCTFFASTLALMARALGIPSRVAIGYTNGQLDTTHENYVVHGTDAHVWTQLYFAGYGWINFEPTQGYPLFARGSATGPTSGVTPTPQGTGGAQATPKVTRLPNDQTGGGGGGPASPAAVALRDIGLTLGFLVALALLVAAAFLIWWRRLYSGLPPVVGAFARLARLGSWSGAPPRPDQTPYEYADQLGGVVPEERGTLRQLSDLYVGERWGGVPAPKDEATSLYDRARAALTPVIAHRWREVPRWFAAQLGRLAAALRRPPRTGLPDLDLDASE